MKNRRCLQVVAVLEKSRYSTDLSDRCFAATDDPRHTSKNYPGYHEFRGVTNATATVRKA